MKDYDASHKRTTSSDVFQMNLFEDKRLAFKKKELDMKITVGAIFKPRSHYNRDAVRKI